MHIFFKDVIARKVHRCHGCLDIIPIGGKAQRQTIVDEDWQRFYICKKCTEYINSLPHGEFYDMFPDGFGEGELKELMGEIC